LRNPCVDWGKACEFSVDVDNEVAIRQIGVEESGGDRLSLYSRPLPNLVEGLRDVKKGSRAVLAVI
jgi:hypothetical protein